jgi:hypothetical protein
MPASIDRSITPARLTPYTFLRQQLEDLPPESWFSIFLGSFNDATLIVLIISAVVSLAIGIYEARLLTLDACFRIDVQGADTDLFPNRPIDQSTAGPAQGVGGGRGDSDGGAGGGGRDGHQRLLQGATVSRPERGEGGHRRQGPWVYG